MAASSLETLRVRVTTPDQTLFNGDVVALEGVNAGGEFSVLPEHIHFISLIQDRIVLILPDGTRKKIPLETGILRCQEGRAEVFTGLSQLTERQESS